MSPLIGRAIEVVLDIRRKRIEMIVTKGSTLINHLTSMAFLNSLSNTLSEKTKRCSCLCFQCMGTRLKGLRKTWIQLTRNKELVPRLETNWYYTLHRAEQCCAVCGGFIFCRWTYFTFISLWFLDFNWMLTVFVRLAWFSRRDYLKKKKKF